MDGNTDEVRRMDKEIRKLNLKLALSEQARARLENHLDKHNSLFKANIKELNAAKDLAEDATKLKDKFVALVAHDLRSPFGSMMGLIRAFVESKHHLFEDKESKYILDRVFKSGDRMIATIDKLLKISMLQTGKITPKPSFFNGRQAVSTTIQSLAHTAEQKGIEIINDVPASARLYADQSLFGEVLLNLLSNAVKFCSRGDKITFFAPSGFKSAIAVRDTGAGINENKIPNLFRHEVQTSTPGTAGELGTGFGLPFCKDIMTAHGGEITVESVPGKGSLFCASLPHTTPLALIMGADSLGLNGYLEEAGIGVIEILNAEQALYALKDKRPHIIIADMDAPGFEGGRLLPQMNKAAGGQNIPVVVITASADKATKEKMFALGAADIAAKPLDANNLINRINILLMMDTIA